jgi:glycosyltransferase involved in cell wall biosynthesis
MGGAERALLEVIEGFKRNGVECYVLMPYDGPLRTELKDKSIPYAIMKFKPWAGEKEQSRYQFIRNELQNFFILIPALFKIKRWGCDVIYTNTIVIHIGAILAFLLRKPHVWHIHEVFGEDYNIKFYYGKNISLKIMNALSTVLISISDFVADKFVPGVNPEKMKVVYESVSMHFDNKYRNINENMFDNEIKCMIIGTITKRKRQEDAINALSSLTENGVKIKLFIIGESVPEYYNYIVDLIDKKSLWENVNLLGYKTDVSSYIQNVDIGIVCSRSEGFGRTTIEFMLAGKPVIGARSGATTELIQDGVNGLLYTPGDYLELANIILYLHEHPEIAQKMGENAQKWAMTCFSQQRYCKDLLDIIMPHG